MARSGGVTFSAVVVLIGSSLTILFGALMALAILWTPNAGQAANLPIPIGYVVTAEAIVFFGFGGWGIASGVGLIKLRQWSRVSMMIYGAILLFFSVIPGIVLSFIPLPAAFSGWNAALIVCSWAVFQMIAAVGLLKLKKWGWMTAIGLQILGIVNGVLILGIPANRMKFEQMMERANISMGARMHQSVPLVLPTWVGIISSLPIVVAILWFLIAQKQVFNTPHNPSP